MLYNFEIQKGSPQREASMPCACETISETTRPSGGDGNWWHYSYADSQYSTRHVTVGGFAGLQCGAHDTIRRTESHRRQIVAGQNTGKGPTKEVRFIGERR